MSDDLNNNLGLENSDASTVFQSESALQPEVERDFTKNVVNENHSESAVPLDKRSKEIAKLHRECAKYRSMLNASNDEKVNLQKMYDNLQQQYDSVSIQNKTQQIIHKLQNVGCLKPALVLKDIPQDCENLDEFIQNYKNENYFLFEQPKERHGFAFRGGRARNYTTSQQMNSYIRSALGR